MATQERVYTVDDVWRLKAVNENPLEKYYLIDGELCIKMSPTESHGEVAAEIARLIGNYVVERGLGRIGVEVGFHPPGDRGTVLLPDVSFISKARMARRARQLRAIHARLGYRDHLALTVAPASPPQSQNLPASWDGAGLANRPGGENRRGLAAGKGAARSR